MSTTLRMTLIGMFDEYEKLFGSLELPEGIDKNDFIDSLLLSHGEKGVMYSNPLFMARMIGVWGRKHYHDFERIYLALTEDYNPLHNFDRHEKYTDTLTGGKSTLHDFTTSGSDNETYTLTSDATFSHERKSDETLSHERKSDETLSHERKSDETLQHVRDNDETMQHERDTDSETEEKTSAFNSSNYEPSKQTIESGGNYTDTRSGGDFTDTTSGGDYLDTTSGGDYLDTTSGGDYLDTTSGGNFTDNHSTSGRDAGSVSEKENNKNVHEGHLYGNIGVTESTTMLEHEINARMKFNLYDILGKMFAGEFLINIW